MIRDDVVGSGFRLESGAALSGLFSEKKRVNAALFTVFQQFISGGAGKCLEIGYRTRVGGEYFQGSTIGDVLQGFLGLEDRERTIQSFCI